MIRAVLFDVDGTLYHQGRLRRLMAAELVTVPLVTRAPWKAPRLWRMLSAFRHVREELRSLGQPRDCSLASLQYARASDHAGVSNEEMVSAVDEWIFRRPLKYLPSVMRSGMKQVISTLAGQNLAIGMFSDYPVADKLTAMGLREYVSLELDATSAAINAFKPHPRGFTVACEHWGLSPSEVLYVGDRIDVDAQGAARAGMPCAIVGAPVQVGSESWAYTAVNDMHDLTALVADPRRAR